MNAGRVLAFVAVPMLVIGIGAFAAVEYLGKKPKAKAPKKKRTVEDDVLAGIGAGTAGVGGVLEAIVAADFGG